MSNLKTSLSSLLQLDGAIATSVVDYESGMIVGKEGSGIDLDLAAAGNSEVLKAKFKTMRSLGIKGNIDDILITLETQYHILRPMEGQKGMFIYLVLIKEKANLALARLKVKEMEAQLII